MLDLKSYSLAELKALAAELGVKPYQGENIFTWLHQKGCQTIAEMSNLSKDFREKLANSYHVDNLVVKQKLIDPDGTLKYQFTLPDGKNIETVLLNDAGRLTLCISCQVGCKLDCSFCATGSLGFARDLSAGEIVDQVYAVERDAGAISNLVFMGMGEPLDNYDQAIKAIHILNDDKGRNLGARHITISTSGIVPGIMRLADESMQLRLSVSLHAPDNSIRQTIMPINKKYPLSELIKALEAYQNKTGRRITIEYVLLAGINDSPEQAKQLIKILHNLKVNINLIEFNPHEKTDCTASSTKVAAAFRQVLEKAGLEVSIRFRRGRAIKAACGQLGA